MNVVQYYNATHVKIGTNDFETRLRVCVSLMSLENMLIA